MIEKYMQMAINFAIEKNHIWPFSAIIVNEQNEVLIQATDCAHISPLYHAEALAIHVLVTKLKHKLPAELTMITTAEPDPLSQSAIHWGNIVHDLAIRQIYYGVDLATIYQCWPFGIDISAAEIIDKSCQRDIQLQGGILADACEVLFQQAYENQQKINQNHPAMGVLSQNVEDFYSIY